MPPEKNRRLFFDDAIIHLQQRFLKSFILNHPIKLVCFPNCKINLGLNILQKRKDGYHDISSVFLPVSWVDVLEIIPSNTGKTTIQTTGLFSGAPADNLCLKVYQLLKKDFPFLPEISIHLHKTIPAGAGLGGGSSDATCMLTLLNDRFNLQISGSRLFQYALKTGSDCPFFLFNKPALASGRGEILEEINISLKGKKIFIIYPGIHVPTADIFKEVTPQLPVKKLQEIVSQPVETWKKELKNDFEKIVFSKNPGLKEIKNKLYEAGAFYSSMTGTGSTIFGIFPENFPENMEVNSSWLTKWIKF